MSYLVTFRVKSMADLATIFQTVTDTAEMLECREEPNIPRTPVKRTPSKPGEQKRKAVKPPNRVTGLTVKSVIESALPASAEKLALMLKEKGYAPNSLSPAISTLVTSGRVEWDERGFYKLIGK